MIDDVGVRVGLDGRVVRHKVGDVRPRAHRHAELEVNLVVRGTATYLLGDRRYALTPGTLTWLFPGQDHVLVSESSDHELWWAVFRSSLVAQIATTRHARPLLEVNPVGQFSRRLDSGWVRRLSALFHEVQDAETVDDVLFNTGLAYLLSVAWRAFLDSDDVVEGVDLHPAVETVARLLRADPDAGDLGYASAGREPELVTLEPDIQGTDRRVDQLVPQPAATATFPASLRHRPAHHGAGRCTRGRLRQLCPVLPRLSPAGGTESVRAAHRRRRR